MILAKQCPLTPPSKTTCDDTERLSTAELVLFFGLVLIMVALYFGLVLIMVAQAIKNWDATVTATPTYWETTATSCTTQSTDVVVPAVKNATSAFNHQPTLETAKAIVASAAILEQALEESGRVYDAKFGESIVAAAAIFEQVLKESGRVYDPNLPMQFATANYTTSREIYAREQAELRGYLYDSHQKDIDREISQEQHQETIACMQEEPGWMGRVNVASDRCRTTISTAILRGVVLVALTKLAPFLYLVFVTNKGNSLMVVAGEIIGMVRLE
jgi:hypothetical protein